MRNLLELIIIFYIYIYKLYFRAFTQCKCIAVEGNRNDRNAVCIRAPRWTDLLSWSVMTGWGASLRLCWSRPGSLWWPLAHHPDSSLPSAHTRRASAQDAVGSASWKTEATCRVGRTSPWAWRCWAASASVSAPQTAVASCLPPAFSAGAPGVFWRGGQSEVVRWSSEMTVSYQQINSLNHRVNAASIYITVQYEKLSKCCNWIVQNLHSPF